MNTAEVMVMALVENANFHKDYRAGHAHRGQAAARPTGARGERKRRARALTIAKIEAERTGGVA